jgi:hypothetical protein
MKILKKIVWVLVIAFVIAQFFGPEKNEGELTSLSTFINETKPSDEVHMLLKETCFDCHSDKTRYPWYSNITPINYWMADHVRVGKSELNFSKWGEYSLRRKAHKMKEIHEEVEKKNMPLDSYTWTHRDANLSEAQIKLIADWAKRIEADYEKQKSAK